MLRVRRLRPRAARGAQNLLRAQPLLRAAKQLDDERLERAAAFEADLAVFDAKVVGEGVDDERGVRQSAETSLARTRVTPCAVVT